MPNLGSAEKRLKSNILRNNNKNLTRLLTNQGRLQLARKLLENVNHYSNQAKLKKNQSKRKLTTKISNFLTRKKKPVAPKLNYSKLSPENVRRRIAQLHIKIAELEQGTVPTYSDVQRSNRTYYRNW
jgi:hypothetical protein